MTAIPDATPQDFEFLKIMERQYVVATTLGGGAAAQHIRLIAHYQRENERLARENDLWLRRFDWLRGTFKDEQIVDGKIIITLGGGQATQQDSMENFLNMWDQVMESDALTGEGGGGGETRALDL